MDGKGESCESHQSPQVASQPFFSKTIRFFFFFPMWEMERDLFIGP